MRSSANPDAQDEIIDATAERPFEQDTDTVIAFAKAIMDEKYDLSRAIDKTKQDCRIDVDAESARNSMRRTFAAALSRIGNIKPTERKTKGEGFKFNATGDQVRYSYDVLETTTPNFDRDKAKSLSKSLLKLSNETSADLDACLINTEVDFYPLFNIEDSFEDALEEFDVQRKSEETTP